MSTRKIAIACQGGGTHAAFTWGVLTQILETKRNWDAESGDQERFDITAMTGTSAGALCALATWYGLSPNNADPECGHIDKAVERLDYLWETFAARTPAEKSHDAMVAVLLKMKEQGAPLPESSPYSVLGDLAMQTLSIMGARDQYLSFSALLQSLCPHFNEIDWPAVADSNRRILAGAIEIYSGNLEVFDSEKTLEEMGLRPPAEEETEPDSTRRWRMRRPISLDGVAASGTLPELLKAQRIDDVEFPTCVPDKPLRRDAYYWDGFYSQNPPVRQLLEGRRSGEKPDEIWIIRINPQEIDFDHKLTSLDEIRDRENELAGNLSLNQELDHILSVNKWIGKWRAELGDSHPFIQDRKAVAVRTIKMRRETALGYSHSSKLHRNREHLETLRAEGREVAKKWLTGWREQGQAFDCYPNDARYPTNTHPCEVNGELVFANGNTGV